MSIPKGIGLCACLLITLAVGLQCQQGKPESKAIAHPVFLLPAKLSAQAKPKPKLPVNNPGIPLRAKGINFQLPIMTLFVLPGQDIQIEATLSPSLEAINARADKGKLLEENTGVWKYTAPDRPGVETLTFTQAGMATTTLHIFSLVPATSIKEGKLGEYNIGPYALGNPNPMYAPPEGYIEVTPNLAGILLTPNIKLGQLTSKQTTSYPRYLVLNEKLLVKLEAVLVELRRHKVKVKAFSFISGYRTPYYNSSIENVSLSRHQYGDAADVFIDEDRDGYMDDLDHDGRVGLGDARIIGEVVDSMDNSKAYQNLAGGMGLYKPKGARTPFVHIDTRGKKARWVN